MLAKESLYGFFGMQKLYKELIINTPIFTVIIEEILWDTKYIKGQTQENMMAFFIDYADKLEELRGGQGQDNYHVNTKKLLQFSLDIEYLRVGLRFGQTACMLQSKNERSGIDTIGLSSDTTIAKYAQISCAVNLQKVL